MKVLLAVGAPHSSHRAVFNVLRSYGLAAANPSRYESQTPEDLHGLMLSSHEVDLARPGDLVSLRPGKLWGEMAVDMFMANISQPLWGWADHQSALAMDFWADFDPQVRFVICYDAPHTYVANALASVPAPSLEDVEAALRDWSRWNAFLLAQFQRHRERSLLVECQEAVRNPGRMLQLIGLEWQWSMDSDRAAEEDAVAPNLAQHLARGFIPADHVCWAFAGKLEEHASIPGPGALSSLAQLQTAWADWVAVRELMGGRTADKAQVESLQAMQVAAEEEQARLKAEIEQLRATVQSAELEQVSQMINRLTTRIESGSLENIRAAELVMENEHLMVALHQAQQDVEALVLSGMGAEVPAAEAGDDSDFGADEAPDPEPVEPVEEVIVDLREDIDGENWYGAEADGRWAGPALQSNLLLPPVVPGTYSLQIQLVDAIAPDIVYGLRIAAFGSDIPFELSAPVMRESFPIVCQATLEAPPEAAEGAWPLDFTFPRSVSPADSGSSDVRQLTVRIGGVQLKRAAEA